MRKRKHQKQLPLLHSIRHFILLVLSCYLTTVDFILEDLTHPSSVTPPIYIEAPVPSQNEWAVIHKCATVSILLLIFSDCTFERCDDFYFLTMSLNAMSELKNNPQRYVVNILFDFVWDRSMTMLFTHTLQCKTCLILAIV